jgi:6-phosphogluconolactonase
MAADLGIDRVMIYRLDLSRGKLVPNDTPFVQVKAGYGPRHLDFHPDGRSAYLINELGCTITTFAYDAAQGRLDQIESVPTLPPSFAEMNHTADIHVHPSGRFVYGSNRGHDSIVIYSIDSSTDRLSYVGHEPTQGNTPRNFGIDPTGTYLLAANQNSDTIVTFRIDQQTGRLTATGDVAQVPMPVCLKFMPVS